MVIKIKIPIKSLIIIFFLLASLGLVWANGKIESAYIKVLVPDSNATDYKEYFDTTPFIVNITAQNMSGHTGYVDPMLNVRNCTVWFYWKESGITSVNMSGNLTVSSMVYDVFWNDSSSGINFSIPHGAGVERNLTISCSNETFLNYWWSNSSATQNITYFYINEFPTQGRNYTMTYPSSNATVLSNGTWANVTVTINDTAKACTMYWNHSYSLQLNSSALTNSSGNTVWSFTDIANDMNETAWSSCEWYTFRCEDAYANYSWYNDSQVNMTPGYTNESFCIIYDGTAPLLRRYGDTIYNETGNYTSGGNYFNETFGVDENNIDTCWLEFYRNDTSIDNVTGELSNVSSPQNSTYNCTVEVLPTDITFTGNLTIGIRANDTVGYEAGGKNPPAKLREYQTYVLKAGWNLLTIYDNVTLAQMSNWFSQEADLTYISLFSNNATFKNFTTYTIGTATNGAENISATQNATYVYVGNDTVLIRPYDMTSFSSNITLFSNVSEDKSAWNFIGVQVDNKTLNETLNIVNGTEYNKLLYVSYYEPSLQKYCTGYRGYSVTSCYPTYTSSNITIPRGAAIWVLHNKTDAPKNNIMDICVSSDCYKKTSTG